MGRGHGPNGKQASKARIREHEAIELRKAGASYSQIGQKLGISYAGARKAVMRVLQKLQEQTTENAVEVKRLERDRLDQMLLGVWSRARQGDDAAINSALKIMARRAALDGLDAPTKQQLTGKDEGPIEFSGLTDADRIQRITAIFNAARTRKT